MKAFLICLTFLLTLSLSTCQTRDETLIERSKGEDVSEAVIRKIQRSGIFTDDQDFLRRLAYVESRFGDSTETYRNGYFGGIWQVDESVFNSTLVNTTTLFPLHEGINRFFNINWRNVTWNDLLKPLYSGIAVRLYLATLTAPIPGTINLQAQFWKRYYRSNGSAESFIQQVRELELRPECETVLDLGIVLDSSGSIGAANFNTAKGFVANISNSVSLEATRIGLVLYSSSVSVVFPIENNLNATEMNRIIWGMPYLDSGTNTAAALTKVVDLYKETTVRPGVPRVVVTLTDGNSDSTPNLIRAIALVKNASLVSFAVGIGNTIRESELNIIALDDPAKVFRVTDYDSLAEFLYRLNTATCEVPQEPELGQNQTDSLNEGERRYYHFEIPAAGLTVNLVESEGKASGWYSYSEETPNSAVHDGVIDGPTFIPLQTSRRNKRQVGQAPSEVFLTIQGNSVKTNYTISTVEGNTVPKGSDANMSAISSATYAVLAILSIMFQRL